MANEAKDVLSRGGAAFNAVREAILGSSMKPEGKFLLDEITKQDIEITDLRSQLAAALEAQQKVERERDQEKAIATWAKSEFDSLAKKLAQVEGAEEHVRSQRDEARARVQRLEAEKREMREALERIVAGSVDGHVMLRQLPSQAPRLPRGAKCAMCGDTKRIKATDGIAEFMVPCPDCWRPKLRRAPQPSLLSQAVAAGEAKEGK